mmetsp:Transcript_46326/g.91338  ORF Transcript_46326/g.91338 Transcript_46326/m.91338 type:complete len:85 (+) Transcript_46326:371-625(+)
MHPPTHIHRKESIEAFSHPGRKEDFKRPLGGMQSGVDVLNNDNDSSLDCLPTCFLPLCMTVCCMHTQERSEKLTPAAPPHCVSV